MNFKVIKYKKKFSFINYYVILNSIYFLKV